MSDVLSTGRLSECCQISWNSRVLISPLASRTDVRRRGSLETGRPCLLAREDRLVALAVAVRDRA